MAIKGLNLGTLYINIVADASKYTKAQRKTIKSVNKMASVISKRSSIMATASMKASVIMRSAFKRMAAVGKFSMNVMRKGISLLVASLKRLGSIAKSVGRAIKFYIVLPLIAVGAASVKGFANFDKAMTHSVAIMQDVTPKIRKQMENLAITMSERTTSSAKDLAEGYFFLASAGLSASQSMASLNAINNLAIAGQFNLARATELAAGTQAALGMMSNDSSTHLTNLTKITDILVGANILAQATTGEFAEALAVAGPIMRQYGISLENGVAVLAAYAKQNKKGRTGGEIFSRMIRLQTQAFIENEEEWKKLGISIVDGSDKMKKFSTIARDLTKALDGMGVTARARQLDLLGFQARSQQATLPLLGMGDVIEGFEHKLSNMGGTAERVANKNMTSFSAQMTRVWNNVKSVGRVIGDRLAPSLVKLGNWFIANKTPIAAWAQYFTDRFVFALEVAVGFVDYMRNNFGKGLELAFNIALQLAAGFGKSFAELIKRAAMFAAEGFAHWLGKAYSNMAKNYEEKFGKNHPMVRAWEKMGAKLSGIDLTSNAMNKTKESLKTIFSDTGKNISQLVEKFKGKNGVDFLSGPLAELKRKNKEGYSGTNFETPFNDMKSSADLATTAVNSVYTAMDKVANFGKFSAVSGYLNLKAAEGFEGSRRIEEAATGNRGQRTKYNASISKLNLPTQYEVSQDKSGVEARANVVRKSIGEGNSVERTNQLLEELVNQGLGF